MLTGKLIDVHVQTPVNVHVAVENSNASSGSLRMVILKAPGTRDEISAAAQRLWAANTEKLKGIINGGREIRKF